MQNGFLHLSSAEEYGAHSVNKASVCSPLSCECLNDSSKNRCEGFSETFGHVLICAWDVNGQKVSGSFWQRYTSKAGSSQLAEERHSWVMHCFCQQHQSVVLGICFLTAPNELSDVPLDYEALSASLGTGSSGSRQTEGLWAGVTLGGTLLLLPFAVPLCMWRWSC